MQPLRQQGLLGLPTRPSTRPHLPSLTTAISTLHGGISIARATLVVIVALSHVLILSSAWLCVLAGNTSFGHLLDHILFRRAIRLSKRPSLTVLQRSHTTMFAWAINTTVSIAVATVNIVLCPGKSIGLLWVGLAITLLMSFSTPSAIFFHLCQDRKRYKPTAATSRNPGGPIDDHVPDCEGELCTAYHKQLAADGPRTSEQSSGTECIELDTHPASLPKQNFAIVLTSVLANVFSK